MSTPADYRAPKFAPKIAAQIDQGLFDFLVPYRKPTLQPNEAARCLGEKSKDFVYDLIHTGKLESVGMEAKGTREGYIVTRRSLLLYLVKRAHFDPTDLRLCIRSFLEALDAPTLDYIAQVVTELRRRM